MVVALTSSRVFVGDEESDDGVAFAKEGARDDWKCVMRVRVVFVRSIKARKSLSFLAGIAFGGIVEKRIKQLQRSRRAR